MRKEIIAVVLFFLIFKINQICAQSVVRPHRCGTTRLLEQHFKNNPGAKAAYIEERKKIALHQLQFRSSPNARLNNVATITIPVVVHILLKNAAVITDAQVFSQIDALNTDFAGLNKDSTRIPSAFKTKFGKCRIRFCLAQRTPQGNPTNGIVRKNTSVLSTGETGDPVKYSNKGGSNAWDPSKYINIWVCDPDSTQTDFLGYSTMPSIDFPPLERGFVNNYECFGKGGSAVSPYNLGRTAVHELGHFFNLDHIWGDSEFDTCDDQDYIGDTPNQFGPQYGTFAANKVITDDCTTTSPGIMWMNYMDYVDDASMVMFTKLQQDAMEQTFNDYAWMTSLLTSDGCNPPPTSTRDLADDNNLFSVFPNPFKEQFIVKTKTRSNEIAATARLINMHGQEVWKGIIGGMQTAISLSNIPAGIYYFEWKQQRVKLLKQFN